ncbi:MAG: GC-type dockerin domain-anchored protein, partial [Phycisphaerales bacterium]
MTSWGGADGQVLIGAQDDIAPPSDRYGAAYFFDLSCGACAPDLDLDGSLTIFDFLLFSNLFQDGDAQADFDGDGELTALDFLAFQTAFDAGC